MKHAIRGLAALALLACVPSSVLGAGWYDSAWAHRIKITVQASKVPGPSDLANFPVYVNLVGVLGGNPWDTALGMQVDLGDLVVTDSTGTEKLYREIQSADASVPTGYLFFRAPVLKHATNTEFYIYWGNAAANEANVEDSVWAGNTYIVHGETNTEILSGAALTIANATSVAGQVGNGYLFDAANDKITIPNAASTATTWTVFFSFKGTFVAAGTLHYMNTASGYGLTTSNAPLYDISTKSVTYTAVIANIANDGAWARCAVVMRDATVDSTIGYENGLRSASGLFTPFALTANAYWGHASSAARNCSIDEMYLYNGERSQAWIVADANNYANPATFYAVGAQEDLAGVAGIGLERGRGITPAGKSTPVGRARRGGIRP